mmetsp:Transcript_20064/g.80037  ORF Transcript_20064/g.80037 Transcript_20064/m.80037 type:complete len:351 (+) Transcript_20064:1214-2266(+)
MPLSSIAAGAACVNGVESLAGTARVRRACRVVQTGLAIAAVAQYTGLLLADDDATTQNSFGPVACAALFAASSWVWVVELPRVDVVPYALLASTLAALSCAGGRAFLRDAWALSDSTMAPPSLQALVAGVLAVPTAGALVAWSRLVVREDHGVLQDWLGPALGLRTLPLFALLNALVEELEFRGIILQALRRGSRPLVSPTPPPSGRSATGAALIDFVVGGSHATLAAVALQAVLFGAQHAVGGFPNGAVGCVLVTLWGFVLGALRVAFGGLLAGYAVHVVADATIGLLIWRTERKRRRLRAPRVRGRRRRGEDDDNGAADEFSPETTPETTTEAAGSGAVRRPRRRRVS